jgi:hypothetical protein
VDRSGRFIEVAAGGLDVFGMLDIGPEPFVV